MTFNSTHRATLSAAALFAIACAACGGSGSVTHDAPSDAVPVAIDAASWPCEPHPPDLPERSTISPDVLFDTRIPLLPTSDDGALDTLFDGKQLVVVTSQQLHFVSLEGTLKRSVLLTLPSLGPGPLQVRDIASRSSGFGVVVRSFDDGGKHRFCQVDPISGLDLSRCTVFETGTAFDGRVVADGAGYSVFYHRYLNNDYSLHRSRFEDNGALIDDLELWRDESTSRYLLNAGASSQGVVLATYGGSGAFYAHHLAGDSHDIQPVEIAGLSYSGGSLALTTWSGSSSEVMSRLVHMRCDQSKDTDFFQRMAVLIRHDLENGSVTLTPQALKFIPSGTVILDGEHAVVVYRWDFYDLRLSQLDSSGAALVSELTLPLSYLQTGIELQSVTAGRAIGPRDYVFVYTGTGGGGGDRRVARVRLPGP